MSTTTLPRLETDSIERPDLELRGRVRRILRRQVRDHLATLSDQRLSGLGLSSAEILSLRSGADVGDLLHRREKS